MSDRRRSAVRVPHVREARRALLQLSRCDQMSSSVLYERLRELTGAGLVARDQTGAYLLTDLGAALGSALKPLGTWAERWSEALQR